MTTSPPLDIAISATIPAAPMTVYALISDVTRMGEFSPETVRAVWLDGATGAQVGARFRGTNRIGRLRWSTTPTVTAAEPGVRFAFRVPGRSGPEWVYRLTPTRDGTSVTESMRQERTSPWLMRFLQRRAGVTDRAEHLRRAMTVTLDRLGSAAAAHDGARQRSGPATAAR